MFFSRASKKSINKFLNLIEQNIKLFEEIIKEKLLVKNGKKLSDDEFVDCYVEGMNCIVNRLDEWAYDSLKNNQVYLSNYEKALKNPLACGFKFSNDELTIGKIYLYYVWAMTKRKASKSDCIKLEKYAVQLIGKMLLDYGIIN